MPPETHDHALNCEITTGRGCDCGLTGMAGVAFYSSGVAVYKTPVLRMMNSPDAFNLKAYRYESKSIADEIARTGKSIVEVGEEMYQSQKADAQKRYEESQQWLKRKMRAAWGDAIDTRKMDTARLLAELERREPPPKSTRPATVIDFYPITRTVTLDVGALAADGSTVYLEGVVWDGEEDLKPGDCIEMSTSRKGD